ncbi:Metal-dependent hydrolase, composite domain superfamily [Fusarium oxysporum f. sp. vasinfectum]|nr:Metal-dependent hydrolase, composite domain superfamily [Fusarium oxysporum f. sp. vasinfectum]
MASLSPLFIKPWLPKSHNPQYLFKNATVIDPVTGTSVSSQHVFVQRGIIAAISSDDTTLPAESSEATIVDVSGKYICPGLIDAHVHISAAPGDSDFSKAMSTPEHVSMLRMTYVCRDILARGFTTVRDCGGAPYALKQATEEWLVPGPRLFISGHALSQTGGHGDFRSCHDHTHCVSGFQETRFAGEQTLSRSWAVAGSSDPTDRLEGKQFSAEEIRAIVLAASNHGTYVTCHAYAPDSIRVAIENGVKGIEHGNLIDEPTAKLMAEKGCFLTPTLVTYQTLADPALPQFLNEDSQAKNKKVLDMGINTLKIAKNAGLTLCYGSDLLGPLGLYQTREFSIRSEALTNLDILQSATINPAKMLGETNTLGQVKTGFKADLLILNSNPLDDITVFERQEQELLAVIKDGRVCLSRTPKLSGLLDAWKTF